MYVCVRVVHAASGFGDDDVGDGDGAGDGDGDVDGEDDGEGGTRNRGASTTKKPVLTSAEMTSMIENTGIASLSRTKGMGTHRMTRGANKR